MLAMVAVLEELLCHAKVVTMTFYSVNKACRNISSSMAFEGASVGCFVCNECTQRWTTMR